MPCCRPFGNVLVPGVDAGCVHKASIGAWLNGGLTLRAGQAPALRPTCGLGRRIRTGERDSAAIIARRARTQDGPSLSRTCRDTPNGCNKPVMRPWAR